MRKKNLASLILVGLFSFNILAWIAVYEVSQTGFLEVNFFDVGQGNAVFIVTPKGHQILIDGGPDSTILEKLAKEMPFWDRTIDLIILTHPHSDHLKGLIDVLERYRVENILWTGVSYDSQLYQEWQRAIKEGGAKIYIAQSGQRVTGNKMALEILYPLESFEKKTIRNLDNTSIIVRLAFQENSFLFTGDARKEVELILLSELGDRLKSNVLKVGHHGSKTSSAEEFIVEVSPEFAVISVGKDNRHGHPHQEVLETLAKYGITVLNTSQDGDIKIFSDGKNLKYEPR